MCGAWANTVNGRTLGEEIEGAKGDQERWYLEHIPLREQVVVGVGAGVGRFSRFFWDASGGTSRVVSIEPLPENVAAIRERIRAANTDRWTVEACAVSKPRDDRRFVLSYAESAELALIDPGTLELLHGTQSFLMGCSTGTA
jgi:hypothetical protein